MNFSVVFHPLLHFYQNLFNKFHGKVLIVNNIDGDSNIVGMSFIHLQFIKEDKVEKRDYELDRYYLRMPNIEVYFFKKSWITFVNPEDANK